VDVAVLIDTHVLLWAAFEPDRLSDVARSLLESPKTSIYVSSASAWEISTKVRLGRLPHAQELVDDFLAVMTALVADDLPVSSAHALRAGGYEVAHRDPFDRMLSAQAELEGVPLVTSDAIFANFPVSTIW
jgi:PIN domain nuclease of toxin-antitoxin system